MRDQFAMSEAMENNSEAIRRLEPQPKRGTTVTVDVSAFGRNLNLVAPSHKFLRNDSLWRLNNIYEPALTVQTLAPSGVALDIGAGFGSFAVPFAVQFPDWTVYCFEPDPESFAALSDNITRHKLVNAIALPFAIGGDTLDMPDRPLAALAAMSGIVSGLQTIDTLATFLPLRDFSRHGVNLGYVARGTDLALDFSHFQAPTLSASFRLCCTKRLMAEMSLLPDRPIPRPS
jgi:hypothetical protein